MNAKEKITCLFNCSTNTVGGGMKNAALFIIESLRHDANIGWVYAVSKGVSQILRSKGIDLDSRFTIFDVSPASSRKSRKTLVDLATSTKADIVYTMAGPAYVNFGILHIQGLSSAYITHVHFDVFKIRNNLASNLKLAFKIVYQLFKSRAADHFIFQTEAARSSYCKRALIQPKRTTVISNAFDQEMQDAISQSRFDVRSREGVFKIFCPGAPYYHKAFQYIPYIAEKLSRLTTKRFQFVLTLAESPLSTEIDELIRKLKVQIYVLNIGPFDYSNIAELYADSDIVFVPSLLETFSSTYLEAIVANKILVAADKDFAREIAENEALYISPTDYTETAALFAQIIDNTEAYQPVPENRSRILSKYGTHQDRFSHITKVIYDVYEERKQQ